MALGSVVGHSCRPDKGKNAVGIACAQGKCALFDFELAKWFESSPRRVRPTPHVRATKLESPGASSHRGLALSLAALSRRDLL